MGWPLYICRSIVALSVSEQRSESIDNFPWLNWNPSPGLQIIGLLNPEGDNAIFSKSGNSLLVALELFMQDLKLPIFWFRPDDYKYPAYITSVYNQASKIQWTEQLQVIL